MHNLDFTETVPIITVSNSVKNLVKMSPLFRNISFHKYTTWAYTKRLVLYKYEKKITHDFLKRFKASALHHVEASLKICSAICRIGFDMMWNFDLNPFLVRFSFCTPWKHPLREKCQYSELFYSVFFGIWTEYGPE